jgi:hypothetical protein
MRREELARLLQFRPFRPFRLRLTNDSLVEIRHPEVAIVIPSAVYVGVPAADGTPGAADEIEIISLLHVMKIENTSASTPPTTN